MPTSISAKKTAYISLRTSREIKEEIAQAAASKGRSLSGFMLDICIQEAQRVVNAEQANSEKHKPVSK
jgi:uncharacterized protein (DUF1778 family)